MTPEAEDAPLVRRPAHSASSLLAPLLVVCGLLVGALSGQTASGSPSDQDPAVTAPSYKPHAIFLPILYYTPETRLALGAGGVLNYRLGLDKGKTRPSSLWVLFVYTLNSQIQVSLKPEVFLPGNKYVLNATLKYELFPTKFYGIGNDVPPSAAETYTPETKGFQLSVKRKIIGSVLVGVQYDYERTNIRKIEAGGLLSTGTFTGSQGGVISGAGFSLNWDNRDNVFFPRHGSYFQFVANFYGRFVGSDFGYTSSWLDLRTYVPIGRTDVLAFQALVRSISGTPPFYELSVLGGSSIMRGNYSGMFRDKAMLAIQSEYRLHLWKRLGLVGFMGVGDVGSSLTAIQVGHLKYSFGGGLRFKVDKREGTNIRLDYAWGTHSKGFYATIQEAF